MKMYVYCVRDKVAYEFGPPFVAKNDGVAWRQYSQMLAEKNAPGHELALYCIGDWDSEAEMEDMVFVPFVPEEVTANVWMDMESEGV